MANDDSWARRAIWTLMTAALGGLLAIFVGVVITELRELNATVLELESEHRPHRRHMGGTGVIPGYDHPGRTVENPTSTPARAR